jgi:hypothetical protein
MSNPDDIRQEIYTNFNRKETDELVRIWQLNNRYEWTDEAIETVGKILQERLGDLPPQNEPNLEPPQSEVLDEKPFEDGSPLDAHLDDENLPEFYDPWEVLKLEKWINRTAVGVIIISAIQCLLYFPTYQRSAMAWFSGEIRYSLIAGVIAVVEIALAIFLEFIVVYLPLRALASILKILMEMEFTSRGARRASS